MSTIPTELYTKGVTPSKAELETPDPSPAEAERAIAANAVFSDLKDSFDHHEAQVRRYFADRDRLPE